MTVAIIVYILIVTLPLIAAAALTERLLRLWSLPVRGAWVATAVLMLLVGGRTLTQQLITPHTSPVTTGFTIAATATTPQAGTMSLVTTAFHGMMALPRTAATHASQFVGPVSNVSLTVLWLSMTSLMLALIGIVYSRMWRATRKWSVAHFAGQHVRVAPGTGPAVVGVLRPEIVVPRWMLDANPADSHLIIMHEMEHRAAHDPVLLAAMWGLVALFPWHPGAWYCLARTRLAVEIDCDARVVMKGASLKQYAQLLVNQARARLAVPTHFWLGATSLLEPSSHLERRLRAMITPNDQHSPSRPYTRALRSASYIAIVSTLAIAACESHVPTAADISGLDAASAQKSTSQVLLKETKAPTFFVNDIVVSAARAKAIPADSIASINIVRAAKQGGEQEIRLVTVTGVPLGRNGQTLTGRADSVSFVASPYMTGDSHEVVTVSGSKAPLLTNSVQAVTIEPALKLRGTPLVAPGAEPLFVIDGAIATPAQYKALNPETIASVEVLKGAAALRQYNEPQARNGVVSITLKH